MTIFHLLSPIVLALDNNTASLPFSPQPSAWLSFTSHCPHHFTLPWLSTMLLMVHQPCSLRFVHLLTGFIHSVYASHLHHYSFLPSLCSSFYIALWLSTVLLMVHQPCSLVYLHLLYHITCNALALPHTLTVIFIHLLPQTPCHHLPFPINSASFPTPPKLA